MQRELKFRAWDSINKTMIAPNNGDFIGGGLPSDWQARYAVMQYTGLFDDVGREICEGDILNPISTVITNYIVLFDDGEFCLYSEVGRWGALSRFHPICKKLGIPVAIIGNVHETPELIKITSNP